MSRLAAATVVDREGFMYLVESGADFVKVGIGGVPFALPVSKGYRRGQASAVIEVAKARDEIMRKPVFISPSVQTAALYTTIM